MSFLTIFTSPKPFTDPHINVIQRNAIRSWIALGDDVEVFLIGNDAGVAEVAAEYGVRHFPDVTTDEKGVPYIGDMFALTRQHSDSPVLAIINTDIILLPDFLQAAQNAYANLKDFVLVGQRWDLNINELLDFSEGWADELRQMAYKDGSLHFPYGSDYFLFSRTVLHKVPDFTIGRAGWDNWMIYHAAHQPWSTIDASRAITIIHQNHDYSHLPGGQIHYNHPASKKNVALAGGEENLYDLLDLDFAFIEGKKQRKPLSLLYFVRKVERLIQPKGEIKGFHGRLFRMVRRYRKKMVRDNTRVYESRTKSR